MKIFFLSFSDYKGGANIAAYSIFKSINKKNVEFLTLYSKKKHLLISIIFLEKFTSIF